MKANLKKTLFALSFFACPLLACVLWLSLRPVEIVAAHEDGNYSSVLMKNFPITDRGKIDWWLENKDTLKRRYDIPKPASNGNFTIIVWLFGEGYMKEGKYDRLCFADMQPPVNCIEKDRVFSISHSKNRGTIFTVDDGEYRMEKGGRIIKLKDE